MDLQVFNFESHNIRTVVNADRSILWCGKDVAELLGYTNTRDALSRLVKDKYKGVSCFPTPSGKQEMVTISTPGLIQLIMSSKLPSAEAFQDWVLETVLPSVLATGTYKSPAAIEREKWLAARLRAKDISLYFTNACKHSRFKGNHYNAAYIHNRITVAITGMTAKELAEECELIDGRIGTGLNHIKEIDRLNLVTDTKKAFASATLEESQDDRLERIFTKLGLKE